jgi:hypothetical protein
MLPPGFMTVLRERLLARGGARRGRWWRSGRSDRAAALIPGFRWASEGLRLLAPLIDRAEHTSESVTSTQDRQWATSAMYVNL